jgi:superfamily I DNA and/or RNA helicase
LFDGKKYDVVMFDEVSMAYVPQIVCAASFAKKHLICVGDFRQLAPIAQSDAKGTLEKDLFAFLGITDATGQVFYHPWLVLLDEQRRMHPDISAFPSKAFYHGLLKNHSSVYVAYCRCILRINQSLECCNIHEEEYETYQ